MEYGGQLTTPRDPADKAGFFYLDKADNQSDRHPTTPATPLEEAHQGGFLYGLTTALAAASSAMSTPPNKYTYPISAIRVIDGDTIEADVDLGFRIKQRQVIRLAGIDAPELRAKDAAERELAKAAKTGLEYVLIACKPSAVVMHSTGLDKYGRSLADVWAYYEDGAYHGPRWGHTNRWMIENNHAAPMK